MTFELATGKVSVSVAQARLLVQALLEITGAMSGPARSVAAKISAAVRQPGGMVTPELEEQHAIVDAVAAITSERRVVEDLRELRDSIRRDLGDASPA